MRRKVGMRNCGVGTKSISSFLSYKFSLHLHTQARTRAHTYVTHYIDIHTKVSRARFAVRFIHVAIYAIFCSHLFFEFVFFFPLFAFISHFIFSGRAIPGAMTVYICVCMDAACVRVYG